jgi:tryptophanase
MPPEAPPPAPYRIKAVDPIHPPNRQEREEALEEAGFNLFNLASEDVHVDLLTDSGVGAMSAHQWAGLMEGDESYAGSRSFGNLEEAVADCLGFDHVLPCHQGRGAEHVWNRAFLEDLESPVVVGNEPFDTTRAHVQDKGGAVVDVTIPESASPRKDHPFKGNLGLDALEAVLEEHEGRVAYGLVTITCNSAGGHPVSLENLQAAARILEDHGVPLVLDVARYAENAWLVREREEGQGRRSVAEIARDLTAPADAVLMSAKKNGLVNIGGFVAADDEALVEELTPYVVLHEGFPTYGGMAGRDLEALARGLREGLDEDFLEHRVGQVRYLHERLGEAGIPLLHPPGGHAVFVDAARFLPHVERPDLPAQALVAELYREAGIRTVEVGTVLRGRDPGTGENVYPDLELVRLAVPPRTYTRDHLDHVVDGVVAVWERRDEVQGLRFEDETPVLRHFTSTFAPVEG